MRALLSATGLIRPLCNVIVLMRALASASVLLILAGIAPAAFPQTAPTTFDPARQFVVVTFSNMPARSAARAGTTGRRYTSDSYGVSQAAHEKARQVGVAYSLHEVISWPIKELSVHCVVYEIPDSRAVEEVVRALGKDSRVTLAQPLQQFHTSTDAGSSYNDPLYGLQTNLTALGISSAHEHSQGAGVRIALIDTGVDGSHPDLRDRISRSRSFISSATSGATARPGAYRHGTAMAGLIAAVANNNVGIVGIAPLARIEVFEACWQLKPDADEAACNTFTLAQALAAAIESRAPLVNLSLAGPPDPLLTALVQDGLRHGMIFVGSVTEDSNSFPTNIRGVIGVGGSEDEHSTATLTAPARHVLTLRPGGEYDFESGSSVAAAEMTGIFALLLGEDSHLSAPAIVSLLKGSSAPEASTQAAAGGVDVNAALARLGSGRGSKGSHPLAAD